MEEKPLNEAEEFYYKVTGIKRRFHINSYVGQLWLKLKYKKK
jgi:hypothetical protein